MQYKHKIVLAISQLLKIPLENIRYKYIDGKITDEEHTLWILEERQKKIALEGKIASLRIVDDNFDEQVTKIFIRASKAHETWKSSDSGQKRQIVNLLFPNLQMDGEKLVFTLQKPFDKLIKMHDCATWLPLGTTLRTESYGDVIQYGQKLKLMKVDLRELQLVA